MASESSFKLFLASYFFATFPPEEKEFFRSVWAEEVKLNTKYGKGMGPTNGFASIVPPTRTVPKPIEIHPAATANGNTLTRQPSVRSSTQQQPAGSSTQQPSATSSSQAAVGPDIWLNGLETVLVTLGVAWFLA
ncbi:MAG: hypothetical protein MMC23_002762 [Stictis urceolatum]|nr:hypothetical protein [Stictis urceolata]